MTNNFWTYWKVARKLQNTHIENLGNFSLYYWPALNATSSTLLIRCENKFNLPLPIS